MTSTTQDDLADKLEDRARKLAGELEYPIERTLEWRAAAELRSLRARVGELEGVLKKAPILLNVDEQVGKEAQ